MNPSVIIAIVEGIINAVPSVISAYQSWVAVVNSGADPTVAQLRLTEAAVDALYFKIKTLTAAAAAQGAAPAVNG